MYNLNLYFNKTRYKYGNRKIQFSFFNIWEINQLINFFKHGFKTFLRHCLIRMKFHLEIRKRPINEHLWRRAVTTETTNQLHSWCIVIMLLHYDVIVLTRLVWFESEMNKTQLHASSKRRVQSPNTILRIRVFIRIPWRAETPMRNVKYTPTTAFFWWNAVVIDLDGRWIRVLKMKRCSKLMLILSLEVVIEEEQWVRLQSYLFQNKCPRISGNRVRGFELDKNCIVCITNLPLK